MQYRPLGKTDMQVSEISFGTWAIGGSWGKVNDQEAIRSLEYAIDQGVNFFDTADVYGDGRSESFLGQVTAHRRNDIFIATKFCRAGDIHDPQTYSAEQVRAYCEASLQRLKREQIDLYQIHCPPIDILKDGAVFDVLDRLKAEGKIRYYGVSVESVEEGLLCMENPNVSALQIIFNIFRQKPLEQLLPKAKENGVGLLARLPLASGLLTGKFSKNTTFAEDDHRHFNRDGASFNVGETFAGIPFEKAIELSSSLSWIAEGRNTMAQAALRWVLDHEAISCVIPGFKHTKQIQDNLAAAEVAPFSDEELERLKTFYHTEVHDYIRGSY